MGSMATDTAPQRKSGGNLELSFIIFTRYLNKNMLNGYIKHIFFVLYPIVITHYFKVEDLQVVQGSELI